MDLAELFVRCNFSPNQNQLGDKPNELVLGVSGGADSVAMALLAAQTKRPLSIWHINHGVRPNGNAEAALVEKLAETLNANFELRHLELQDGADFEARARLARYEALPDNVCVAHTADDRAETVLLNLLRGAGLAGVAPQFSRVQRPIIALRRAETRQVCQSSGVPVINDPMNHDLRFARVVVREQLLPLAADALGRDPVPLINRHADLIADALQVIQTAAQKLDATDTKVLKSAPRAVASEALRNYLMTETESFTAVDAASIERVMAVVHNEHRATEIEGGYRVARSAGRLRIEIPNKRG